MPRLSLKVALPRKGWGDTSGLESILGLPSLFAVPIAMAFLPIPFASDGNAVQTDLGLELSRKDAAQAFRAKSTSINTAFSISIPGSSAP